MLCISSFRLSGSGLLLHAITGDNCLCHITYPHVKWKLKVSHGMTSLEQMRIKALAHQVKEIHFIQNILIFFYVESVPLCDFMTNNNNEQ